MNGDKTACPLVTKCNQSERQFLTFTAFLNLLICLSFWLLNWLEKCIAVPSENCMKRSFCKHRQWEVGERMGWTTGNKHCFCLCFMISIHMISFSGLNIFFSPFLPSMKTLDWVCVGCRRKERSSFLLANSVNAVERRSPAERRGMYWRSA